MPALFSASLAALSLTISLSKHAISADVSSSDFTNATAIGYNAKINASNMVQIGNAAVTAIKGQVAMTLTSDKRLKNHIADLPLGIDFMDKLKNGGVVAQELHQTLSDIGFKEAGIVTIDPTPEKFMAVRYNDFIASMIKATQEQKKHC